MASDAIRVPLEDISSSNILGAGYDDKRKILAVRFKSGDIFHYADVPLTLATEFYTADSKGRFYAQNIKGRLPGQKMTGRCEKCGDGPGWLGDTCDSCGTGAYAEPQR